MPAPDEQSASFPVLDASEPRDTSTVVLELEQWFVAQLISFASTCLNQPRFWYGADMDVLNALGAVGNQVIALMVEVEPVDFDPEFRIEDGDLEWRENDESDWINLGNVQGPPGEQGIPGPMPDITVSAITLPPSQPASAEIEDYHITFGIPRGQPGTDGDPGGLWTPPETTTDDKMCTAARILADVFADRLQDNMETIDAATTALFQTIDSVLDLFAGFIPVAPAVIDSIVEMTFEAVTEVVIDWVRENCYDLQARALARDEIFCAMKKSGDYVNFWDEIDWLGALPDRDFDFLSPGSATWENFGEWMQWAFATLNGENCGWIILAWGAFMSGTIDHLVQTSNSVKQMIGYAINTASYNDQADCATADCVEWEQVWDFTTGEHGWEIRLYPGNNAPMAQYNAGVGFIQKLVTTPSNQKINYIQINSPVVAETFTMTYFSIEGTANFEASPPSVSNALTFWEWSPAQQMITDWGWQNGLPQEWSGARDLQRVNTGINVGGRNPGQGNPGGSGIITKITMRGLGENPYE